MPINDRAHRAEQANAFADQLGIDRDELRAAAEAAWSNLNPQRVAYSNALSVAGIALRAAHRVRVTPVPLWENDLIQFARLLDEIRATQENLDFDALSESMDLERDRIDELFERAMAVFEASKDALVTSKET